MRHRRTVLRCSLVTLAGWAVLWLAWYGWLEGIVDSAASDGVGAAALVDLIEARRAVDPAWEEPGHALWVGRTVMTRLGLLWMFLVVGVLAFIHRGPLVRRAKAYLTEPDAPLNLAILRITTFGALLLIPAGREEFLIHASLPEAILFPPSGIGPLLTFLIPDPFTARLILGAWITTTAMAMLGLITRPATIASTLLTLLVLGIPQLHGKVNHAHHLVWFALLLATSPCGDVLSIDRWIRRRRPAPRSDLRYGLPLRITWLLLGMVYFFPGVWKLWTGGLDWIFSEHLRNQIWHQWTTHANWEPVLDPTGHPWLLRMGGLGVVVFEMSFVLLMFRRSTRIVALVIGLLFHLANLLTLNIGFVSLMAIYPCLIDSPRLLSRLGLRSTTVGIPRGTGPPPRTSLIPIVVAGAVLLVGNGWYGIRGDNYGWPFACYPKFGYPIREPVRTVLEFEFIDPDGGVERESFATGRGPLRTARWIGTVKRVLKMPPGPGRDEALIVLAELAAGSRPLGGVARFIRSDYSTRPDDRGEPPLRSRTIAEITLGATVDRPAPS
ncbi:MAG: HTTM domain-containing protein [Phycisphaeraceae bacterium]|nr:HTTM domain-containing protein [Phycisphaeraceae bacterium]